MLGAALAIAATLGIAACDVENCPGRGNATTSTGTATAATDGGVGTGITMETVVLDDFSGCTYDSEQYVLLVGSCSLVATLQYGPRPQDVPFYHTSTGYAASPNAAMTIVGNHNCTLHLGGTEANVTVTSGSVDLEVAESTTVINLLGTLDGEGDGGGASFTYNFQGGQLSESH